MKLSISDIQAWVRDVRHAAERGDYEQAHALEDKLHLAVLESIAMGDVDNPRVAAAEAASTKWLRFERHAA